MRKIPRIVLIASIALLVLPTLHAQQSDAEAEVLSYIARQSTFWYEQEIQRVGTADPGPWQAPLESSFLRLANSSGQPGFSIQLAVLNDTSFNAACFPGGQFVINAGTLGILDSLIEANTGTPVAKMDGKKLRALRESLIAPVIAHELGHFYCRHTYNSMKLQWAEAGQKRDVFEIKRLRFSQENELEADKVSYLLLKRAGYDPNLIVLILELLNEFQQLQLKQAPSDAFNVYLTTHPSPHARLAAFQGANQQLHQWAADLERAFSDVQLGTNLEKALQTIDNGLKTVPGNIFLSMERAIILHKQWLLTVSLKDQKLRGIIDSPAFRDEMVFSQRGTRGVGKVIPGDRRLFLLARDAYIAVYQKTDDAAFYSNFALLLAYSPDANDEKAAVTFSSAALNALGSLESANNLAVVLYLVGQKDKARSVLGDIAGQFDAQYSSAIDAAATDPAVLEGLRSFHSRMRLTQALDRTYVGGNFTPLLNLALLMAYEGQKDKAKRAAQDYFGRYETGSEWALHLATTAGADIPKPPAAVPAVVKGIQVGSPLPAVLASWGKASRISQLSDGGEAWEYGPLGVELQIGDGVVQAIALNAGESPKVGDKFGVGSPRADIERAIGKPKRLAGTYTIYEGPQNYAIIYAQEAAQQIVLFP